MYGGLKVKSFGAIESRRKCVKILWMGERSRCCIKPCGCNVLCRLMPIILGKVEEWTDA